MWFEERAHPTEAVTCNGLLTFEKKRLHLSARASSRRFRIAAELARALDWRRAKAAMPWGAFGDAARAVATRVA